LLFVNYINSFDANVEYILRLNFHIMLLIIGGIGVYVLIMFLMMKLSPVHEESQEDFKWKDG